MATVYQDRGIYYRSRVFYHAHVRKPILRFCTGVLQSTPISSESFGPPKGVIASTPQWIEKVGSASASVCKFVPVHAAERLDFGPLRTVEAEADFHKFYEEGLDSPIIREGEAGNRYTELPATFVAEIPEGRAYGCDGAVITPNDYLLQDLSAEYIANRYIPGKHLVLAQMRLPKVHHVAGTVAVLTTLSAQRYYAHWMMDMLPRIGLLTEAGLSLDKIDRFFVNSLDMPYQRQTLATLGVPSSKIIDCAVHPHIKADRLLVPSLVSGVFAASSETCSFLRHNFLGTATSYDYPKRIYVSRANTAHRRIINEAEVVAKLSAYGVKVIEPQTMSLAEQSQVFAHADIIVMPLGSAMANAVYCHPGAKVIEILNPRSVQACTWAVCSQRDADYYFMFAEGVNQNDGVLTEDLTIDVDKLIQTLHLAI